MGSVRALPNMVIAMAVGFLTFFSAHAQTPSTTIKTEYLMTVHLALDPPLTVDQRFRVFNVRSEGSWVDGPNIKAKILPPAGDWSIRTDDATIRLDVRATLRTDDGAIIFMSYGGIVQWPAELNERLAQSGTLKAGDTYWITAPTFTTDSAKYGWLNGVQAVAKMIAFRPASHIAYDVFAVR